MNAGWAASAAMVIPSVMGWWFRIKGRDGRAAAWFVAGLAIDVAVMKVAF